ncbi:hypothetical protein AMTRI_Chr07g78820 [Amborella trichopoda]
MSSLVVHVGNNEASHAEKSRSLHDGTISFSNREQHPPVLGNGQDALSSFETGSCRIGEVFLLNGEIYSGSLQGNMPEGSGKYVWSDGCTYEGELGRGLESGKGKISWPSGATYEGKFWGGYMHGNGTFIWADGMTYTGGWQLNVKHGFGRRTYTNGDVFEGSWNHGIIEGPGEYFWANGNVYIGNMKGGKMSGKGVLTWTNGDSFEGNWLNGLIHGFGVYTWADGGCYVGTWSKGLKDGKGAFYPKGGRLPAVQESYHNALRKGGLLVSELPKPQESSRIRHASSVDIGQIKAQRRNGSRWASSDKLPKSILRNSGQCRPRNVSLERRWSLDPSFEKVIGNNLSLQEAILEGDDDEADADVPILEREYMQGVLISELVLNNIFSLSSRRKRRWPKRLVKDIKKPGEAIIKGHRSYDLMLNLQLGIRYTVGKITPIHRRDSRTSDFGPRASFWMNFPREGSQLTPPHQSGDFKWKDYCPMVFRNLRELFKIDAADYMMSICGSAALRELSSPGKSGSIFFLSQDDRFMIKTLRKSEVKVLLRMLPNYYHHVQTYENTLITKFFGLHRIKPSSGQKFRFVVMGNMFCTELRIHRRFDLKGSSQGRSVDKVEIDENTTLKDLDLNYLFYLEPSWRDSLLKCDGGGGAVSAAHEDEISCYPRGLVLIARGPLEDGVVVGPHIRGNRLRASAAGDEEVDLLLPGTARLQIQLGVNMPARAEYVPNGETNKSEQLFHEVYDVVLYLGIIDILQDYNMNKRIEHAYKSLQFDSLSISAVDPMHYSHRFLRSIQKVFPENNS